MKLFLASFTHSKTRYMADNASLRDLQRLVWAKDRDEARDKIYALFDVSEAHGDSQSVYNLELHEAIA